MIHINLWPSNSNQSKQICTTLCYTYAYGEANLFVCVCVCVAGYMVSLTATVLLIQPLNYNVVGKRFFFFDK